MTPSYSETSSNLGFGPIEPKRNPSSSASAETLKQLRQKILSRGLRGIFGLLRMFKVLDINGNGTLAKEDFLKVLKDFRIDIKESEFNGVLQEMKLSQGDTKTVDYNKFLEGVRNRMNQKREDAVRAVFEKFDLEHKGFALIDEIKSI